jgi:serine/threonine protein kinase
MTSIQDPSIEIHPGDILAGKYRVERVIGTGGMGVVLVAHHLQLDEKVALKFLLPEAMQSPEAVARFVSEARAAVKSEHVARVIDVGELENRSPYIVMEFLDGVDLAAWVKHEGVLPVEQAVDFILQTCEALAEAHALGIVHRDLKPANLFCIQRADGQLSIKVLDFGISKVMTPGAATHEMTGTNALMGSPHYMSPEQMDSSRGVDSRTDIWALGVILFELLTGRHPFDAEALTSLAIKVANEPAPLLRTLRADAPPGLEQVIATCLGKERAHRFQSVGELAIALKEFGPKHARLSVERALGTLQRAGISEAVLPPSGEFRVAGRSSLPSLPGAGPPQTAAPWIHTGAEPGFGGRAVVGFAAAVVLGVLATAAVLLVRKTGTPTAASTAQVVATGEAVSTPVSPSPIAEPAVLPTDAVPALPPPVSPPAPATAKPPLSRPRPSTRAPTPPSQPGCDPPYYFDPNGTRIFKKECL